MTPEREAFYAKIYKELEARNFSRPHNGAANGGYYGVDISQWAGQSTFSCFKSKGYSFAVVRNYCQTCRVDPNGVHSVANAWAAGIAHVDIYLYPSWTCSWSAAQQVDQAIDSMGSVPFGQLWFDVEAGGAAGPSVDHAWLVAGINRAVQRIGAKRVGIYSSKYGWQTAMGSYSGFASYPLWYAHYDGSPSFSDFSGFAGWSRPAIKQFNGDVKLCSFDVDQDWYA